MSLWRFWMLLLLLQQGIVWLSKWWCDYITRSYLLTNIPEEGDNKLTDAKLQGYAAVLSVGSTRCKANTLGMPEVYLDKCMDVVFLYTQWFNFWKPYRA